MANERKNESFAQGRVEGAAVPVVADRRIIPGTGNWTVVRNGLGDYTLTWTGSPTADQIDPLECGVSVQARGALARSAQPSVQTDGTLQILTFDLAVPAAADSDFDFEVKRVGGP